MSALTYIDHNGQLAYMEAEERESIERSGKCSLERYAFDDGYVRDIPRASEKIEWMHQRPHAIEIGARPVHQDDVPSQRPYTQGWVAVGDWHLGDRLKPGGYASCGAQSNKCDVFGFTRFGRMRTHRRTCRACYLIWRDEFSSPDGRRMK